jgi:peptidyl-prolyl cis-trans isomerase SurA
MPVSAARASLLPALPVLPVLLGLLALAPAANAEEMLVDGIAAQVGNDIVLVSEVMEMVGPGEQRMRAAGAPETEIAKLRAAGLEEMIEWRMIERIVRETELYATDAEVDQTIEDIANGNGITVAQLEESVASQNMSFDDYKEQIKRELEKRKIVSALVAPGVHVEESDVKAAYRDRFASQPTGGVQVHLRQILVPAGEEVKRTMEEACMLVAMLRERIVRGESFEELAQEYSAAAPEHGGDIGWLHEQSLANWMVVSISEVEDGGVSNVVELPFGCNLIKVVERRQFEPLSYDDAKPALHAQLFEESLAEEYRSWMEEMRKSTFIERRGYFAEAARLREQTMLDKERSGLP